MYGHTLPHDVDKPGGRKHFEHCFITHSSSPQQLFTASAMDISRDIGLDLVLSIDHQLKIHTYYTEKHLFKLKQSYKIGAWQETFSSRHCRSSNRRIFVRNFIPE